MGRGRVGNLKGREKEEYDPPLILFLPHCLRLCCKARVFYDGDRGRERAVDRGIWGGGVRTQTWPKINIMDFFFYV